ncbi:YibE/F family protein [bacterium]|nr:YibE/F family protein [bacterium]
MKKLFLSLFILLLSISPTLADEKSEIDEVCKGKIVQVNIVECIEGLGEEYVCYTYDVYLKDSQEEVQTMISMMEETDKPFSEGDAVYLTRMQDLEGNNTWNITGYDRAITILLWAMVFAVLIFVVCGRKSFGSILSLIISFVIIYFFAIPQLLSSSNLLFIGYLAAFLILTIGMYLAHGFTQQTSVAIVSTYFGIGIVSILAWMLIKSLHLTGMGEETAFWLSVHMDGGIDIQQLFFVSIIIGAVGVLDDVAVGQVASMYEIHTANIQIGAGELYRKTMNVGREHVSSMINTLFIVYAGSSLSLVMLMYMSNRDMGTLVSIDLISEEIVRTLAISIALLLVVPISTYISAKLLTRGQ